MEGEKAMQMSEWVKCGLAVVLLSGMGGMPVRAEGEPVVVAQATVDQENAAGEAQGRVIFEVEGRLDENSEIDEESGRYFNFYKFEGQSGDSVTAELTSESFDAAIVLLNSDGEVLAYSNGTASIIAAELLTDETYIIAVSSIQPGVTGTYQLVLQRVALANPALLEVYRLNQQAAALYQARHYDEAEQLLKKALVIQQQVLGELHPDIATSLGNLAELYRLQGRYDEAELIYVQALEMLQQTLGEIHPDIAINLNGLAVLYQEQKLYEKAEILYQKALEIWRQTVGESHPNLAIGLDNLAELYRLQGRYDEAELSYQQALEIRQQTLGHLHPEVATSLNGLAWLYQVKGNYEDADLFFQQALEIGRQTVGETHPVFAQSLNGLAELYTFQGRYEAAEQLHQQSLSILRQTVGETHPSVANSLNNLALLYIFQGRYKDAELLYKQVLETQQQTLGTVHPDVATSLNNLALLYHTQGRYEDAELLYQRSLAIWRQTLGELHPAIAIGFNNLISLVWAQNDLTSALMFMSQGLDVEETNLATNLIIGSEQQRQDYIATISSTTDAVLSLNLQSAPTNPQASHLALETLRRRKGRILDATTNSFQTLRQQLDADSQALLEQYLSTQSQLSALLFRGLGNLTPEAYRQHVADLKTEANQLEVQLSRRSAEFRAETQPITLEAVQAEIPADAVFVEYALY